MASAVVRQVRVAYNANSSTLAALCRGKSSVAAAASGCPFGHDAPDPNSRTVFPDIDLPQPSYNQLTPGSHDGWIMPEEGGPQNFVDWHNELGKTFKVSLLNFGGDSIVHGEPNHVKKAFNGNIRPNIPLFDVIFEEASGVKGAAGSVSANGQKWKELRAPWDDVMMRGKAAQKFYPTINEEAKLSMKELTHHMEVTDSAILDIMPVFQQYVARVIGQVAFGPEFGNIGDADNEYTALQAAQDIFPTALQVALDPIPLPPSDRRDNFYKAIHRIGDFGRSVIAERRARLQEIGAEAMLEQHPDFLSALMAKPNRVTGEYINDNDLLCICLETLLGGTDTTTNTLNLGMTELGRLPNVMEKLREEIVTVCGTNPDEDITTEMLMNTPYLSNVVNEMLRIWPATPLAGNREQEKDVMGFDGIETKKGTVHINHCWASNKDASRFPDPETFNPDRWSTEGGTPKGSMAIGTFGYGARACPGQKLARAEAKIILAQMFKQYKPVYLSDKKPDYYYFITMHPVGPLKFALEKW